MKKNDSPPIHRKPTFMLCQPLIDTIDKNLIRMKNYRDLVYGKLHLIEDTSRLAGAPAAQVVPATNHRQLTTFINANTVQEQYNYVTTHYDNQRLLIEDRNTEEACKELIISVIDKVYLEELWDKRFGYKGKTLRDIMDLLIDDYQATLEEREAV